MRTFVPKFLDKASVPKRPGQKVLLVLGEQMRQFVPAVRGQAGQNFSRCLGEQVRTFVPKVSAKGSATKAAGMNRQRRPIARLEP